MLEYGLHDLWWVFKLILEETISPDNHVASVTKRTQLYIFKYYVFEKTMYFVSKNNKYIPCEITSEIQK